MGANHGITEVPVNINDGFELIDYNQDIDKVKICNYYEKENIINFSPFSSKENSDDEHPIVSEWNENEELGSLYTDYVPDFKDQNRRKRENKIYRKRNKYILQYNIDKEVKNGLQQIIHMKSFNELENYLRQFILHNKSVMTVDHRKNKG